MTSEDLKKVNETLKGIPLKGKEYVQVNTRVLAFRELFPMGEISTEILKLEDGVVLMKSYVKDENGKLLGTGMAQEKEDASYINKTSYIENCETSAVGRALAMLGIGTDASMCSAEELVNAVNNQEQKGKPKNEKKETPSPKINRAEVQTLTGILDKKGIAVETILNEYKITALEEMSGAQYANCIKRLEITKEKKEG